MGVFHHRPIVSDGLIFSADGNNKLSSTSGSTTVRGIGTNYGGTASSSGIVDGEVWTLDGISDKIEYTSSPILQGKQEFTYSVWFYNDTSITQPNSFGGVLVTQITSSNKGTGIWYDNNGDNFMRFQIGDGGNGSWNSFIVNLTEVPDDEWAMLTLSFKSPTGIAYVNGVQKGTYTNLNNGGDIDWSNTGGFNSDDFTIGRMSDQNSFYFEGKISNVNVYDRQLTLAEIKQNYEALKYRFQ